MNLLTEYFKNELPVLECTYSWKIPAIDGFNYTKKNNYDANVELKHFLHKKWHESDISEQLKLARTIVVDWGQVKGNKSETLESHVELAMTLNESSHLPLEGVASYSKILSIVNYDNYAIYDARVAACLNAIQINYNKSVTDVIPNDGLAFHYIPGRNNVTGNVVKKCGFSQMHAFKRSTLIRMGWRSMSRDDCYRTYLETLKNCLKDLHKESAYQKFKLYDLEMALFSNAEKECGKAISAISV